MTDQTPENPNKGGGEPEKSEEEILEVEDQPCVGEKAETPPAPEEKAEPKEEPKADRAPEKEKGDDKGAPRKNRAPRKPSRRAATAMQAKSNRNWYGQMDPGTQAKLMMVGITGLLLFIFLLSLLFSGGGSNEPNVRYRGLGAKREKARALLGQGKQLIREAERKSSGRERNSTLKRAEDILWKAQGIYEDLIEEHGNEEGYEYLQTEIGEIQKYKFHCQKTRTLE